ncbi:MAG: hypothetical protein PHI18_02755, partial [bacterium]|nr:hypothetical protein [bacterium]
PTYWDQYLDITRRSDVSRLNATWAHSFSKMKLGATLRYEGQSHSQDKDEEHGIESMEESYSAFGFTAGITALEDKLDAAISYDAGSFSEEWDGDTYVESDGTREFGLVARYWAEMSDQYTLVPHFRYVSHKLGWSVYDSLDFARSYSNLVLGAGNNWRPTDNMLVIFETGISLYSDTYENPDKEYTNSMDDILYWRIGCETEVNSWLWGRLGAERAWRSTSYEFDPYYLSGFPAEDLEVYGNPTFGYSVTKTYIGATAHWRRLFLDLVLEPEFFNAGPYFISGRGHNLTSRVSLKFDFNK